MRAPVLALLALLSCALPLSLSAQTVTARRGGADVRIAVGEAAALPRDFPADVFVPTGAHLRRVEQASGGRLWLEFACAEAPDVVAGAARNAMLRHGWRAARVAAAPGALAQAWEKDSRAVVLAADAEDGGTRLRLQLLPRR